jgi:L-alanine-DL-glutamate epimerase-like enolase superfamily enzyme
MHDPVESYTYDDAVKVGRALEKLNYAWMEEPLQDYDLMGLKKLSDTLDLPILAMEWIGAIGGQPYNASAFLAMHAVDIVRQRGVGITGQIKLAHLAESFGVDVHGGNPHVILAIKNDPIFEAPGLVPLPKDAKLTFQGTMVVENGYMYIACGDYPVEEPSWDEIEKKALAII